MTTAARPRVRCAIYTRKSSEEGLEQSFNSLQAQREACEAYIASQRHEGWHTIAKKYDDGGFTGGNMNRPGLKQLLEDIAARLVDTVVVYKVDRLTRSLMDFAKIIEAFDQKGVTFVSVTQQFNTTTSMGRLTLNVLLSFAQFEREVTGERIRDKVAASKKKGMWMGGPVPLGYDLADRKLVINQKEAKIIQEIFEQYLRLGSVAELKKYLERRRIRTKVRTSADGGVFGGKHYSRGALYKLLNNRLYIGQIAHRGETYAGQHPAIISEELWKKVSALLAANNQGQRRAGGTPAASILTGLVFDTEGNRYTPTHAVKGQRRYRYYTSQAVIQKRKQSSYLDRIPAKELEDLVSFRVKELLDSPDQLAAAWVESGCSDARLPQITDAAQALAADWLTLPCGERAEILRSSVCQVVISPSEVQIRVDIGSLSAALLREDSEHPLVQKRNDSAVHHVTVSAPFRRARYRGELRLAMAGNHPAFHKANSALLKAMIRALQWKQRILNDEIHSKEQLASEAKLNASYVSRILRMASLGPDLVEAIVRHDGVFHRPVAQALKRIPLDWNRQNSLLLHANGVSSHRLVQARAEGDRMPQHFHHTS